MATTKSAQVKWHGDAVTREVREEMKRRLAAAGDAIVEQVRRNIDEQGPPGSLPGEFPHKISGELSASVHARLDKRELKLEVVADAEYAAIVEEHRPFLRRTLREMKPQIRRIMLDGSGVSRGMFKFTS